MAIWQGESGQPQGSVYAVRQSYDGPWLGMLKGLVMADPVNIKMSSISPPVIIEKLDVVIIFVFLAATLLYRFRLKKLRAKEKILSLEVAQRTKDLEERNIELEKARQKIQHYKELIEAKNMIGKEEKPVIDMRTQGQEKIQREMVMKPTDIAISSTYKEFMKEVKKIMGKNISNREFGVDELAKSLNMSRATLNRKLRALTGKSTNQFIQSYRLKRAAQLLKTNFGNVTEVALEVGFSSSAYFSKCFKEKYHQLPHTFQASESRGSS